MHFGRNVWTKLSESEKQFVESFSQKYKDFLKRAKTEREVVNYIESVALDGGYSYEGKDKLIFKPSKSYIALFKSGKRKLTDGLKLIVSHIDSPRVDTKPQPIYEANNLAFMDTQYYGGIKTYQWFSVPLQMRGYVLDKNGRAMHIVVEDTLFTIPDVEPHVHRDYRNKPVKDVFPAEKLDVLIGGKPLEGENENAVKKFVLKLLEEKFNITETDFISAEISFVPAYEPSDVGIDKSMVGAYGQDDRICVFTSLHALMDLNENEYPLLLIFVDKEEIGSEGKTSAQSLYLKHIVREILRIYGEDTNMDEFVLMKSKAISADVMNAINPLFKDAYDENNTAKLHYGVAISKYTGYGGKYLSSEASAEFTNYIVRLFEANEVFYQTGVIGKVDQGGGGTVAMFLARYGMDIIDIGPPIMSMHSLFEISSKADLYMTYKAYKVFLEYD